MSADGAARAAARALWAVVPPPQRTAVAAALSALGHDYQQRGPTRALLLSPRMPPARRREVLRRALPGLPPAVADVIDLLVRQGTARAMPALARHFQALDEAGPTRAQVFTAFAPSDKEREAVRAALAQALGRPVSCQFQTEPGLVAGVVVRAAGTTWDYSLKGRLARMRETLVRGRV